MFGLARIANKQVKANQFGLFARGLSSATPEFKKSYRTTLCTPLDKENKLNFTFSECDTIKQLEDIIMNTSKYDFNSWNVVTAFSRLGRMQNFSKPTDPAVVARLFEIGRDCYNPIKEKPTYNELELEMMCTGIAFGLYSQKFPQFIIKQLHSLPNFDGFINNSLTNLAFSFNTLKQCDEIVINKIVNQVLSRNLADSGSSLDFQSNHLSLLVDHLGELFAQAEIKTPKAIFLQKKHELFSKLGKEILVRKDLDPQQLANICQGLGRARESGDEFLNQMCTLDVFEMFSGSFPTDFASPPSRDLILVLEAVSIVKPPLRMQLFENSLKTLEYLHDKITPGGMEVLFESFARVGFRNDDLIILLLSEVERRDLFNHIAWDGFVQSLKTIFKGDYDRIMSQLGPKFKK